MCLTIGISQFTLFHIYVYTYTLFIVRTMYLLEHYHLGYNAMLVS
jgi:hypothetical protein